MNMIELLKQKQVDLVNEPDGLASGLTHLADTQVVVSLPVKGAVPVTIEQLTKDNIRTYVLAMIIEIAEFTQTLDWKPWKTKTDFNPETTADEFADILAFLGLIVYYLNLMGISSETLARAYNRKSIVNIDRFLGNKAPAFRQASIFEELEK